MYRNPPRLLGIKIVILYQFTVRKPVNGFALEAERFKSPAG
jgi:hypothetical protein